MKLILATLAMSSMAFAATATKTTTTTTQTAHTTGTMAPATGTTTMGTAAKTDTPDAKVSANVAAANNAEIAAGQLASTKALSPQVKAFAKHMVDEHTANNKMAMTLDKEINVAPMADATATKMTQDAQVKLADLQTKSGADFDKAYMALQVDMHQQVLAAIDSALLPEAQAPAMKSFLTTTKTHVQQHLAEAKKIQAMLR